MRLPPIAPAVFTLAFLAGCASTSDAERAAGFMTGSFSSEAQAAEDPEYFDIRLFMVPIWEDRSDGEWLYVEQAVATALERPYRQRVYHVVDTDEGPRSDVYTLPGDPILYAGAWRDPELFDAITPESLALREGCSIFLTPVGAHFEGSTRGKGCMSSLGEAAYATSEVIVKPGVLTSWDRGFDAQDEQAWGAVTGAYIFVKQPQRYTLVDDSAGGSADDTAR